MRHFRWKKRDPMSFPKTYSAGEAPRHLSDLVERLVPLLIRGGHPALKVLGEQWQRARIGTITLSGAGFFADIHVAPDAPRIDPPDFEGGDAYIEVEGVPHGAGCVLFVRGGYLSMLEGFVYEGSWGEDNNVLSVKNVVPIDPASRK